MSDLIKVKPKKSYEWYQDNLFVYVVVEAKNTTIKKIDIELTDTIFKANFRDLKKIVILDLCH